MAHFQKFLFCSGGILQQPKFANLLTKSCKNIFYVSAVNCYCTYIFKGSNFRFSGIFFSEHVSRTAILAQALVITCKYNFYSFSCIVSTCLTFTILFFKYQSEKRLMSNSYGLIIEFSKNEELQKYRIILSQRTNYLHK